MALWQSQWNGNKRETWKSNIIANPLYILLCILASEARAACCGTGLILYRREIEEVIKYSESGLTLLSWRLWQPVVRLKSAKSKHAKTRGARNMYDWELLICMFTKGSLNPTKIKLEWGNYRKNIIIRPLAKLSKIENSRNICTLSSSASLK